MGIWFLRWIIWYELYNYSARDTVFTLYAEKYPVTGVTCDTAGIISPTVQIVAAYQVAEALKILVEDFSAIRKTFFMFDIWSNQNHFIKLGK